MMNERIRELYRQASDQAYVNACVKNKTDRPQNNTVWNEFPEVFAELIVRECLEVVRQSDDECYDEWDYADRDLCGIIKEHFGVE